MSVAGHSAISPPLFSRSFTRIVSVREAGLIIPFILIVIAFGAFAPNFLSVATVQSVLSASSISIVVAAGMTAAIVARQIDLSIGAIAGIAAYAIAMLLSLDVHPVLGLGAGIAIGLVLGAANGTLIAFLKVPAIIVTLGTATVLRGFMFAAAPFLSGPMINASQIPQGFRALGQAAIAGVPLGTLIALAFAALIGFVMARTPFGRNLYAIGSNPEAARYAGIPVAATIIGAMILVSMTGGIGGFLHVMRYASVNVRTGTGLEFEVIAAVVIGGVGIFGGSGRVLGAVVGVLLLNTIARGFILTSIPEFWKVVATGAAILLAVSIDAVISRRRERQLLVNRRRAGGGPDG